MINLSWKALRQFIVMKGKYPQFAEDDETLHVLYIEGTLSLRSEINKAMEQEDLDDFDDNFRQFCNQSVSGEVVVTSMPASASKTIGNKKLFKRVNGIRSEVVEGVNILEFCCPYPWAKFLGIEFFWAEEGTFVSLEVYDTPLGTYSGVPNYKLNQFGFDANIGSGFYSHKSEFDADLYQGMRIKITYNSAVAKTIGVNFIMNEVKD